MIGSIHTETTVFGSRDQTSLSTRTQSCPAVAYGQGRGIMTKQYAILHVKFQTVRRNMLPDHCVAVTDSDDYPVL